VLQVVHFLQEAKYKLATASVINSNIFFMVYTYLRKSNNYIRIKNVFRIKNKKGGINHLFINTLSKNCYFLTQVYPNSADWNFSSIASISFLELQTSPVVTLSEALEQVVHFLQEAKPSAKIAANDRINNFFIIFDFFYDAK
jgi:hypothetical protein